MKKYILSLVALVATSFTASAQPTVFDPGNAADIGSLRASRPTGSLPVKAAINVADAPVFMKGTFAVGPLLGSANWGPFSDDSLTNLFEDVNPAGAPTMDPAKYKTLGHRLDPRYVLAPSAASGTKMWLGNDPTGAVANEGGNTLWSGIHIWSARLFYPTGIVCQFFSTGGLFNKTDVFSAPNLVYGRTSKAAIWGEGGRRVSDSYIQDGTWGGTGVNEFAFVGSASKTLLSANKAQADSNIAWMMGHNDYEIVAVWTLYGTNGEVLARYAKKVQTKGDYIVGSISLTPLGNGVVRVGINAETNRTGFLEVAMNAAVPHWQTARMVNAGDTFDYSDAFKIFRYRFEP